MPTVSTKEFPKYPKGFASPKPEQTITEGELKQLLGQGGIVTKKYNGNRCHVLVGEAGVEVYSIAGRLCWTPYIPQTAAFLTGLNLPAGTFLDGEFYVPSKENVEAVQEMINAGVGSEGHAAGAAAEARLNPRIAVFDVLFWAGEAIYSKPFAERRKLLEEHISASAAVHVTATVSIRDMEHAFEIINQTGWEGMVINDPTAPLNVNFGGNVKRNRSWKVKIRFQEDLLATGCAVSKDTNLGVGTLFVSRRNAEGIWEPVGKVGSFEITFDRIKAVNATYPYMIEVSHYGVIAGNLQFAKVVRRRDDLVPGTF
jgi:ATP-dependent DNA ligase